MPLTVKLPVKLVAVDVLAPLPVTLAKSEVLFKVTAPLVPPPDKSVPAVTAVISPCGIVGKVVKSPAPFIY